MVQLSIAKVVLTAVWSDSAIQIVILMTVPECPNEEDMGISGSLFQTWNIYLRSQK